MIQDVLVSLRAERDRLDSAISALEDLSVRKPRPYKRRKHTPKRTWSAAARKRMSQRMKERWASGKMK